MDSNGIATEATKAHCNGVNIRQQQPPEPLLTITNKGTLGCHLARRLIEIGVNDVFSVPGDFNLTLLDHIVAEPNLNLIGCCNELNAGYAADGYARCRGVGACIVTFTVGSLSMINAIAGAYSEDLPIICIVGGPNSNDFGNNNNEIIHHSIGLPDFSHELSCYKIVTCHQVVIKNLEDAHEQIDTAISMALSNSKPVYISICCNLPAIVHPSFSHKPVPLSLSPIFCNEIGLAAAVEAVAELLNKAVKPVMVGGPKLVVGKSCDAFIELADISGYPIAVMPSAKGLVPEHHRHFIGTYWGAMSSPSCAETVESADAYLFVGPIFSDLTSAGHTLLVKKQKSIIIEPNRVVIGINGPVFGCILMKDFLKELAKKIKHNNTCYEIYNRINYVHDGLKKNLNCTLKDPLTINTLFHHIQKMLTGDNVVIAEVGDSWFNCQKLKLPQGCKYECQMQYGSLGWSIGAALGYAQAVPEKRVIACIGDGSFQMAAQEISTILRCGQKSIIFLINNGGYGIEVQIHDGPYNVIKNWDYTGLVDAIHNGEGKCWTTKVHCEEELVEAIEISTSGDKNDCFCFIEAIIQKNDTSKESLQMGSRLSAANSRPPNTH